MQKKLFKHGGSKSVDLPMSFVYSLPSDLVNIEERKDGSLLIRPVDDLSSMESDPLFTQFIAALHMDAMKHPEKLKNVREAWDSEWDDLLSGVDGDEE